jgi:hypothetical protein
MGEAALARSHEVEAMDHPDRPADLAKMEASTKITSTPQDQTKPEQLHDPAEDERIIAEEGRISAEQQRRGGEEERRTAEERRTFEEWRREESERLRTLAETARRIAEDARDVAEAARREAELARQETAVLDRRFSDQQEILGEMQRTLRALETPGADQPPSSNPS